VKIEKSNVRARIGLLTIGQLIVLDCLGYSLKLRDEVRRKTGKPGLSPRALLAEAIKEFI
jgi:hypothetical protein